MVAKRTVKRSSPTAALDNFDAFNKLSPTKRHALASVVASQLGPDFRAGAELVGDAKLATVLHQPSEICFALIPGGEFQMGFTAADRRAFTHFFPRAEHRNLHTALKRTEPLMTPSRKVTMRPFALAQQPLSDAKELTLFTGKAHSETFSRNEAESVLAAWGFRFPSEAECEYVAREGQQLTFLLDVAKAHFGESEWREQTAWGIEVPGQTVWVGDNWHVNYKGAPANGAAWISGPGLPMHRGSFSLGLAEMQSVDELVFALSALRQEPLAEQHEDNEVRLRLAISPDDSGEWPRLPTRPSPVAKAPRQKAVPKVAATKPTKKRRAAVVTDAGWLDAVLVEPDDTVATTLASDGLRGMGFPLANETVPLPGELSAELRAALCKLVEARPSLPLPELAIPSDEAVRKRWLGLAPPGDLETVVEYRVGKTLRSAPFWRAAHELDDAGDWDNIAALLPAAAMVRGCVEIALTRGYDYQRPEPTWPMLIEAGATNSDWAETTLLRLTQKTPRQFRSMNMYALLYPLAVAGKSVAPFWTTYLDVSAPPEAMAVWAAIAEAERDPAMVAAIDRELHTTSVLNDPLRFVARYQRPALAEACLTYFTSKEGRKKHGASTMKIWVQFLRKVCDEQEPLRCVLAASPEK